MASNITILKNEKKSQEFDIQNIIDTTWILPCSKQISAKFSFNEKKNVHFIVSDVIESAAYLQE